MANKTLYLTKYTSKVYVDSNSNKSILELLWGDQIILVSPSKKNNRYNVNVRWAKNVWVNSDDFDDKPLLELYFIDVGQGDGVLIVTPERKHLMIDGGYTRDKQPHGKSAADFIDWKFFTEYGMDEITLDAMICSHCDADHYGGLWDLIDNNKQADLDTTKTIVKEFYHAGVAWWKDSNHKRFLGPIENGRLIKLLSDKKSVEDALENTSEPMLQGEYAEFLQCILESGAGITRLGHNPNGNFEYLPGFDEFASTPIKILGPIETVEANNVTLKHLGSNSQNTNGNSLLLRIDYGKSRILLTGDLNKNSQTYILESLSGNTQELSADVVKSCHHGSDDCSFKFMQVVQAASTIISSGDDETHSHPRPTIVATAGATGYKDIKNDELKTPLVYSTEISRSLRLGDPYEVSHRNYLSTIGKVDVELTDELKTKLKYTRVNSGGLRAAKKTQSMGNLKVVDGIIYGLVNVRTDGEKILCGTLNEGKRKWEYEVFNSRF